MQDFKLALVSQHSRLGHVEDNLAGTRTWAAKAKRKGADLICFPELSVTGHGAHRSMVTVAEPVPDGPICERLVALASELDLHLCFGMAEREGPAVYNTQVVVGPTGVLGKARKVHLSNDEYFFFRHGTQIPVVHLPFASVGMIICYDNLFPEHARCLTLDGAELLLAPHAARTGPWCKDAATRKAIVKRQMEHYRRVHPTRAYDNGCYVGVCNASGAAADHLDGVEANHAGGSLAAGPDGEIIAQTPCGDFREQMLIVDMTADALVQTRTRHCHPLTTRRPELFTAITRPTD